MTGLLDGFSRDWISWIAAGILPASLLAAGLLLVERLKAPIPPRLGIALWCLVLLRLLWPPGLAGGPGLLPFPEIESGFRPAATGGPDSPGVSPEAPQEPRAPGTTATGLRPAAPAHQAAAAEASFSWSACLLCVQGLAIAGWWSLRAWRTRRLRRWLELRPLAADALDAARRHLREAGLPLPPRLGASRSAPGPLLLGVLRPTVVLPEKLLGSASLRSILIHEAVHWRRRDPLVLALAELVLAMHAVNPAAWLAVWRLRALAEEACDQETARRAGDRSEYANALVEVSSGVLGFRAPTGMGAALGRSRLARRVGLILEPRRPLPPALAAATAAAMLVAAILTLPAAAREPQAGGGESRRAAARPVRIEFPEGNVIEADAVALGPGGLARLGADPGREVVATIGWPGARAGPPRGARLEAAEVVIEQGAGGPIAVRFAGPVRGCTEDGGISVRAASANVLLRRGTEGSERELNLAGGITLEVDSLALLAEEVKLVQSVGKVSTCRASGGVQIRIPSGSLRADTVEWSQDGTLRCPAGAVLERSSTETAPGPPFLKRILVEGSGEILVPQAKEGE